MGNIKIDDNVLDRMRKLVAKKYEGKMWGKLSNEIEIALAQYAEREELTIRK